MITRAAGSRLGRAMGSTIPATRMASRSPLAPVVGIAASGALTVAGPATGTFVASWAHAAVPASNTISPATATASRIALSSLVIAGPSLVAPCLWPRIRLAPLDDKSLPNGRCDVYPYRGPWSNRTVFGAKPVASRPDFVKVYRECSESFPAAESTCGGRSGLDPGLLPHVVSLARRAGLTVTAHVLTAADFRVAVAAGVMDIAHLPGWLLLSPAMTERARLSDEDARLAARMGTRVTTTTVASRHMGQFRTGP